LTILYNFFIHFSLNFLIFGETTTLRHGDGKWGVLLPTTFFLVVMAVVLVAYAFLKKKISPSRLFWLSVLWIVFGILPAAIGRDVPHANRALVALPGFLFLELIGAQELIEFLQSSKLNSAVSGSKGEKNLLVKSVIGTLIALHFLFAFSYLNHYFTVYAKASTSDFQDGYLPAMQIAKHYEPSVDKILFTSYYGQPYIYALFVRQTNPISYQGGSLIKYEFSNQIQESDRDRVNTLVVATPQEIHPQKGDILIYGADGSIRFVIVKPKK